MKCQAQLGGPLLDIVRRHPSSAHRYAFTRVELIVLTLILALLAPMFCATLSLSKKHVGRTCCYNNLRRLALASAMYAHDNLGYMAYPNWGAPPWPGWLYTPTNGQPPDPGPGGAYATNEIQAYRTGLWFQYLRDPRNYLCPVDVNHSGSVDALLVPAHRWRSAQPT